MPTVGWALESAQDRYLEATDPVRPRKPRTHTIECPFCTRTFSGKNRSALDEERGRHISRDHPLARPILMVEGRELPADSALVKLPVLDEVQVLNTTSALAQVDGAAALAVEPEVVPALLTAAPRRLLVLELVNERGEDRSAAAITYTVRVDVASEEELAAVDDAFFRFLARDDVSRDDVRLFADETEGLVPRYRDGLASYVYGRLDKDVHESDGPHVLEDALAHLGRAAHELAQFPGRRVGSAVAACARFNLNDFADFATTAVRSDVDAVGRFLTELASGEVDLPWPEPLAVSGGELRCPIDEATFALLDLTFTLPAVPALADRHLERLEHATLTTADRVKLAVILGEHACRKGRTEVVRRCARELYNDRMFEKLADRWGA